MRYTLEEIMDIGRRVHERELNRQAADIEYKCTVFDDRTDERLHIWTAPE